MINLLPWREELREIRKKRFYIYLTTAVVVCSIIMVLWSFHIENLVTYQQQRNLFLTQKIAEVDSRMGEIKSIDLQKVQLENRVKAINQLQVRRYLTPHVLELLVKIIPDSCQLLSLSMRGGFVLIDGVTDSSGEHVSNFIRLLDDSGLLEKTELVTLNSSSSSYPGALTFSLKSMIQ